jgi:uncharacterized membrane protein
MTLLEIAIEANVILNLVLSLIIIVWDLYFYFKMDEREKWTKLLYAFVGACWFVRYLLYLLDVENFSKINVNAPLVLLLTFTLLSLALGSIIRVQKIVGFDEIKTDVKNLINRTKIWISKPS